MKVRSDFNCDVQYGTIKNITLNECIFSLIVNIYFALNISVFTYTSGLRLLGITVFCIVLLISILSYACVVLI